MRLKMREETAVKFVPIPWITTVGASSNHFWAGFLEGQMILVHPGPCHASLWCTSSPALLIQIPLARRRSTHVLGLTLGRAK
jgi:hypothetical protein